LESDHTDSFGKGLDDEVFGRILDELDRGCDPADVERRICGEFPDLAAKVHQFLARHRILELAGEHEPDDVSVPDRLGDFKIIREIGRGGMGMIYEAVQEPFRRRVALKTIRGDYAHQSPDSEERFLREQAVLAKLHHTHIVPIFAAGKEGPLWYYAMEYVDGAALSHMVRTARAIESSTPGSELPSLAELVANPGAPVADDVGTRLPPTIQTGPQPVHTAAPNGSSHRVALSSKYVRSVAKVMRDAANALHHANEAGVFHRDLKPSNVMVDAGEHCWVLDFGLASYQARREAGSGGDDLAPAPLASTTGLKGTPHYMAPEQFEGRADARTDVWGLGLTLYELLTLRPAFGGNGQDFRALREEIRTASPPRIDAIVEGVPADLVAICRKAIAKEPENRYQTANELAADLDRWLKGEPVKSRPPGAARRLAMWSRRNPAWATTAGIAALALLTIGLGGLYLGDRIAVAAQAKTRQAEAERNAALEREQGKERELRLLAIQRLRMEQHQVGWSAEVQSSVREVAQVRRDSAIQAQAAAALAGMDGRIRKSFDFETSAVSFDPLGQRLLIGGTDGRVRIWDLATDQTRTLEPTGEGPFAFRPDGSALQLTVKEGQQSLELRDLDKNQSLRSFGPAIEGPMAISARAISPDGRLVAAGARKRDESGTYEQDAGLLSVWESDSGRLVRSIPATGATDIALAPDGSLLAVGHEDGHITVWPLPGGDAIATLEASHNLVNCLSFGPDPLRRQDAPRPGTGWLLAAGELGGLVTVWDLHTRAPRSFCRGTKYDVFALAFRPDGMTLATAGNGRVYLWDIATGRPLIGMRVGDRPRALAFSPEGSRLAIASETGFTPGFALVWELEDDRGIQTLRGLLGPVEKTIISPDGRFVAALSDDWQVAIWDRTAGRLLHVFNPPTGAFADNAALAFDPAGRRLAYAARREAMLWDVETGRMIRSWKLPEGFQDQLAFHDDQLLSIRVETTDERVGPYSQNRPEQYPRIVQARNLLAPNFAKPIWELRDFNRHVFSSAMSPDGRYFAAEGLRGPSRDTRRRIANLYDARTGTVIAPIPTKLSLKTDTAWIRFDSTGTVINHHFSDDYHFHLLAIPGLTWLGEFQVQSGMGPGWLGPGATRWFTFVLRGPGSRQGATTPSTYELHEQGRDEPILTIAADLPLDGTTFVFSRDGTIVAAGNIDGSVSVYDLAEIQRRLAEVGLGW
jgi:serine/threonine protein kinase/WD40 repeat protein